MRPLLGFFNKHQKKLYLVLGAVAVIVVIVVALYVWRKSHGTDEES